MTIISQDFLKKLMVSCILLCALTLTSTADTEGRSPQIQTALGIPNTTFSDRQSRPSPTPTYVNTMATKQDAKSAKPQRSVDALHSSEGRFTAKSPLVLRLLQEQESTDISSQLVHLPVPQLHPGTEEEAVYYQEAPHENTGGVQENAGPEKETFTNKVIRPTKPARYQYVYRVKDPEGNNFGHSEARVDDRTWGRYFVELPDGRQKTVHYWADATGFHAEVEYKGHAAHPSGAEK